MKQKLQQIIDIKDIKEFKKLIKNGCFKKVPTEIISAVTEGQLHLIGFKEIFQINELQLYEKTLEIIERKKRYDKDIVRNAKVAIKQKKSMANKIEQYNKLCDEGIILSSIWDFGKRKNYAGDPFFYGNAPTQVVEQCILRLTEEKDTVLDVMAGSGTTIDVCKVLKRKSIAFDLNPKRKEIIKNDSRNLPLKNNTVDLVFIHPPYWDMVKYSQNIEDLSKNSLNEFYESMDRVITEARRVVKNEKYIAILIGDIVRKGKVIPLTRKIANIAESCELEDCGSAVKITKNSVSQIRRGKTIYAELARSKNLKMNHDTILFFKKTSFLP